MEKLDELRAKLIASRQATSSKKMAMNKNTNNMKLKHNRPTAADMLSQSNSVDDQSESVDHLLAVANKQQETDQSTSSPAASPAEQDKQHNKTNTVTLPTSSLPRQKSPPDTTADTVANQSALVLHAHSSQPNDYFQDVDLWLNLTGFHEKVFREQKLKTYKTRLELEEKKRALELAFAELERDEAAAAANNISTVDRVPGASAFILSQSHHKGVATSKMESARAQSVPRVNSTPTQPASDRANRLLSPSAKVKRPLSPSAHANNLHHRGKMSRLNTTQRPSRRDHLLDTPLSARRASNQR
jgi:DNA primase